MTALAILATMTFERLRLDHPSAYAALVAYAASTAGTAPARHDAAVLAAYGVWPLHDDLKPYLL